jgi:hypothetical protein
MHRVVEAALVVNTALNIALVPVWVASVLPPRRR